MTLAELKNNQIGTIQKIAADFQTRQRLASMGLLKGTPIEIQHSVVSGDIRCYLVRGYSICLSKAEASLIILQDN